MKSLSESLKTTEKNRMVKSNTVSESYSYDENHKLNTDIDKVCAVYQAVRFAAYYDETTEQVEYICKKILKIRNADVIVKAYSIADNGDLKEQMMDFKYTDDYEKNGESWSDDETLEKFKVYLDNEFGMKGLSDTIEVIMKSEWKESLKEKLLDYLQ